MLANTLCTSATSAKTGVRTRPSSSNNRELLRRLCSLDSRRGRLAGVITAAGLAPRDEPRIGSNNDGGGGGSCALSGDGCTAGIKSYWARYWCKASSGNVEKSICYKNNLGCRE